MLGRKACNWTSDSELTINARLILSDVKSVPDESGSCISESLELVESKGPAVDDLGLARTASVG